MVLNSNNKWVMRVINLIKTLINLKSLITQTYQLTPNLMQVNISIICSLIPSFHHPYKLLNTHAHQTIQVSAKKT